MAVPPALYPFGTVRYFVFFFFLRLRRPPRSTLFPYPTLVRSNGRIELTPLDAGFCRVVLRYGFMQGPNVPSDLANCEALELRDRLDAIHYFVGHVDMLANRKRNGMAGWRDQLFVLMASNTEDATAGYQIPTAQTMKVGLQVGI